jgi:hypothetical protein
MEKLDTNVYAANVEKPAFLTQNNLSGSSGNR